MGSEGKGDKRDTPMKNRAARHGPPILDSFGGGTGAEPGAGEARTASRPLRRIVLDAVRDTTRSGRPAAFAVPPLDAIRGDPDCRRLAEDLPSAVEKAGNGLRAGRSAATLRAEIKNLVMDDVRSMMVGRAFEGVRRDLLGGDQHEQEMHFGALAEIVADGLAEGILKDGRVAPGENPDPAELIRGSLLNAEPALFLAIKTVAALTDAAVDYACKLGMAERNDPKIVLITAVTQAIVKACETRPLCDLQSGDSAERRERLGGHMADSISNEIERSLADHQTKIGGPEAEG